MLYLLTAGKKALADGGVNEDVMSELDKTRCGVLIGSAMGGMKVSSNLDECQVKHRYGEYPEILHHSSILKIYPRISINFYDQVFLLKISIMVCLKQVFNDAIEALRISYRKMNPFCVPFATTNMGSAILAMDLVSCSR